MECLIADGDGYLPAGFAPVRDWLAARVPPESGDAIVHSDCRIGNVVIAPDAPGRVAAVLDWKLATVGDPLLYVGYFLASVPEPGEPLTRCRSSARRCSRTLPGRPLDPVTSVRHDLRFDDGLDLRGGLLEVSTRDGAVYRIAADANARGGYMSGGGYGGQHGRPMGRGHLEHDVYPLDGSVSPRILDSALTDRLTAFTWDGTPGRGIFEFALTRSPAYAYKPTLS